MGSSVEQTGYGKAYRHIAADTMNRERNLPKLISSDYYWQRKRREVAKLLERNRTRFHGDEVFVELGCGRGRDIWSIRDVLGGGNLSFVCVDANTEALELARARKAYHDAKNVNFAECDITGRLPWERNAVDIVYSSEVFEHIPNIDALVEEVARILKPEGHLLLTTPNEPNIFQRSFYSAERRRKIAEQNAEPERITDDGTPLYGHVTLKTNNEWDDLLAAHGFGLVDRGRGAVWYGGTGVHENKFILAAEFLLESVLDSLPRGWVRNVSDQMIALYEKKE